MKNGDNRRRTSALKRLGLALCLGLILASVAGAAKLTKYTVCDLRVMYLFDHAENIDWPTLYYLNEEYGARVDLVTTGPGALRVTHAEIPDKDIHYHTVYFDPADIEQVDSALAALFAVRRPDIVIVGQTGITEGVNILEDRFLALNADSTSIFNIVKIYREVTDTDSENRALTTVRLNRAELYARYRDRLELEVPKLISWARPDDYGGRILARYDLIRSLLPATGQQPDFVSGLHLNRLPHVIDSILGEGAVKDALVKRARNFLTLFGGTAEIGRQQRVRNIMSGFKELVALEHQISAEPKLRTVPGLIPYVSRLRTHAQAAVLEEIGLAWQGSIILRDSPHGPKLKFRASLSVNGPQEIELSYINFHPYWDTTTVALDAQSRKIAPHQTFVREYLVDIDRDRLEARMPESLLFTAEIVYGSFPLTVESSIPIWERPDLNITFQPDFHFIQPFARLNVDRVVTSQNWKVIIDKPRHYYGSVHIDLNTPRGVFAGAYRQEIELERGRTREIVRIPFSVSNLFEQGIQTQTVSLTVDGRPVTSDTGLVRLASCSVADTIKVGFLPDSTGLLEDILRMTDAIYRPLTDRSLVTGDIDAYNVILLGSGALREYPSFREIRGRIEDYLRNGGSLVVFGQPTDWPDDVLPVSLVPQPERVAAREILNRIEGANVLSRPHRIDEDALLGWIEGRRTLSGAIISPAERVFVTPEGATLLSVSRLGNGQIIFCGLPLVEMISDLNLEAIHLFANLLNY